MKSRTPTMVRLTEVEEAGLKSLSVEAGCSVSEIIRTVIDELLDSYKAVKNRQAKMSENGAQKKSELER